MFDRLQSRLAPFDMAVLGAVPAEDGELKRLGIHARSAAILPVISFGKAFWKAFQRGKKPSDHPMDDWTRTIIDQITDEFTVQSVYPFEQPYPPIQRWAERTGLVSRSPMGLLIHHKFGLWHAYRAALIISDETGRIEDAIEWHQQCLRAGADVSPCLQCMEKPCLTTCPASAYGFEGFDDKACGSVLSADAASPCNATGCLARNACPVGAEWRYEIAQQQFHQKRFLQGLRDRHQLA